MSRRDEIAANLEAVRGRIAAACADAGRAPDDVRLVVVTKFFPACDVRLLADLGVTDVGENRHQEAEAKAAECADLGLTWHFVGGLQSNKAAAVAAYADVVESVDRAKLVAPLDRGAARARPRGRRAAPGQPGPARTRDGRAGADPDDLPDLAAAGRRRRDAPAARPDGGRAARGGPAARPSSGSPRSARTCSPSTPTPPGSRPA